jgi:hypothetical protein
VLVPEKLYESRSQTLVARATSSPSRSSIRRSTPALGDASHSASSAKLTARSPRSGLFTDAEWSLLETAARRDWVKKYKVEQLSAVRVRAITEPGRYADGNVSRSCRMNFGTLA